MSKLNELLLWEKYRPKKFEDIILLPRIREHFKDGLKGNYIFYGSFGTGKTSLARILIGSYEKNVSHLEINSSLYTSIDVLRSEIDDFCKYRSMFSTDGSKYVFLDEFDRVSAQFQDAFKAFIEKYSKLGVRFIITTNHINKISDGIKSRIPSINFNSINTEEEKYIMREIYKRINNIVLKDLNKEISRDDLASIIKKGYPDLRSILVEVENYLKVGSSESMGNIDESIKIKLFEFLYQKESSYETIQHYLLNNFGAERIDSMLDILGSDFVNWSLSNNKNVDKLFECNYIITDHIKLLESSIDPMILGMTVIGRLRDVLI